MPLDALLVCAAVTSIFVAFAAPLAWASARSPISQHSSDVSKRGAV